MSSDPASLDNLRDIIVPSPVPWWPPAVGWWFVLALLAAASMVIGVRAWRAWRANAYRRAALRELRLASRVGEIAGILKRTALCAYPRTDIASLSGMAWCRWLENVSGRAVPETARDALTRGVYHRPSVAVADELRVFVKEWIQHHRSVRVVESRVSVLECGVPAPLWKHREQESRGRHSGRQEAAGC